MRRFEVLGSISVSVRGRLIHVGLVAGLGVLAAVGVSCAAGSSAGAAEVINTIPVGSVPLAVSSDGTHVWVADYDEDAVSEIEAASGKVIKTIPSACCYPAGVSSDGTHVWVVNHDNASASEIDAASGEVIKTITVGGGNEAVSSDGTHVWIASDGQGNAEGFAAFVNEIDAASGEVIRNHPFPLRYHPDVEPRMGSTSGSRTTAKIRSASSKPGTAKSSRRFPSAKSPAACPRMGQSTSGSRTGVNLRSPRSTPRAGKPSGRFKTSASNPSASKNFFFF